MKTVLVTGGLGYIGSHLCVELLNQSYEVIVIDNLYNSKKNTFDLIKNLSTNKIKFFRKAIGNEEIINIPFHENDLKLFDSIDIVIHLAAFKSVEESIKDPLKYYSNNIGSTISTIAFCEEYKINKFIFASTCAVYDINSPYASSKKMCEGIISDFCATNKNFNAITLRFYNVLGAHKSALIGDNSNKDSLIYNLFNKSPFLVYGDQYKTIDGTPVRDYIHINDLVKSVLLSCNKLEESLGHEIYNVGSEKGYSVLQVISAFEIITGKKLKYQIVESRKGDIGCIVAENNLDFKIEYDLEKMLLDSYNYYLNQNL